MSLEPGAVAGHQAAERADSARDEEPGEPTGSADRVEQQLDPIRVGRREDKAMQLKTGTGGLVDVEFTVQLLQMRHPEARTPNTLEGINALESADEDLHAFTGEYEPALLPRLRDLAAMSDWGAAHDAHIRLSFTLELEPD